MWHPSHRHLAEQQGGLVAARVDLASSSQKVLHVPSILAVPNSHTAPLLLEAHHTEPRMGCRVTRSAARLYRLDPPVPVLAP